MFTLYRYNCCKEQVKIPGSLYELQLHILETGFSTPCKAIVRNFTLVQLSYALLSFIFFMKKKNVKTPLIKILFFKSVLVP